MKFVESRSRGSGKPAALARAAPPVDNTCTPDSNEARVVPANVQHARNLEEFLARLADLLLPLAALAVVLFTAAWVVVRLRARYRGGDDPAADAHRMLTQLGDLRRRGGLSEEEYRKIKGRLAGRLEPETAQPRTPEKPGKMGPPEQAARDEQHN